MPSPNSHPQDFWLKALLFTLFGYALLDRSFANLYIGEAILVIGFLLYLLTARYTLLLSDSLLLVWTAFAFWGFCRTVPFLSQYHLYALRDAVIWGYGVFTVLIVAFVRRREQIEGALRVYRWFLRIFVILAPVAMLVSLGFKDSMPTIPWSNDVGIISVKPSDLGIHLAAAALFLMLFPARRRYSRWSDLSVMDLFRIACWLLGAVMDLIVSRGGFLAMVIPIGLVSILRPMRVGLKVIIIGAVGLGFALLVLSSGVITIQHHGRTFTVDEAISNVGSIVGVGHESIEQQGTKDFRTLWWAQIVKYTVFGPYRWTGKGFGINLAESDSPAGVSPEDLTTRSPHNGSMTVLARMGIPGLALWIVLNAVFAFRILAAYRKAVARGSVFWSSVDLWIFCYWLAIIINMSFDVYIEGPQGGIWLWSIIGFGIAAMRIQSHEARQVFRRSRIAATKVAVA